jgi:hypothetical protein
MRSDIGVRELLYLPLLRAHRDESDAGPMSARAGKPVDTGAGSRSLVERDDGRVAGSPNCRRDRVLGPAQGCFRKRVASVIEPIPSTQRRTIAAAMA